MRDENGVKRCRTIGFSLVEVNDQGLPDEKVSGGSTYQTIWDPRWHEIILFLKQATQVLGGWMAMDYGSYFTHTSNAGTLAISCFSIPSMPKYGFVFNSSWLMIIQSL